VDLTLSKDFLNLLESFDLIQWVKGMIHIQGHMLDLDFSHNLLISDMTISDLNFSDHKPLLFTVPLHDENVKPHGATRWSHEFNFNTINHFSQLYRESWMFILRFLILPHLNLNLT